MSGPANDALVRWRVRIQYREPAFERKLARLGLPYRCAFRFDAATEAEAREAAVAEFWRVTRLSGVAWARTIVKVECARA